jgi:hypothetical protein
MHEKLCIKITKLYGQTKIILSTLSKLKLKIMNI